MISTRTAIDREVAAISANLRRFGATDDTVIQLAAWHTERLKRAIQQDGAFASRSFGHTSPAIFGAAGAPRPVANARPAPVAAAEDEATVAIRITSSVQPAAATPAPVPRSTAAAEESAAATRIAHFANDLMSRGVIR